MLELITQGGIMMIPIMIASVLALGVVLDRLYVIMVRCSAPEKGTADHLIELIQAGNLTSAEEEVSQLKTLLKEYYLTIIREPIAEEREHAAEQSGDSILFMLNSHLGLLSMIGSITPLMGLLGTVLGMIRVFFRIASAGTAADIGILAGGIWEALITTAAGMAVAIPVVILHFSFSQRIKKIAHQMRHEGERIITALNQAGETV